VRPQFVLEVGIFAEVFQADGEETGGRLLARGEQERRRPHDCAHLRCGPVGVRAEGQTRESVVAGLAPAVLNVGGEPGIESSERVQADVTVTSDLAR
jgi:hypothetical protein